MDRRVKIALIVAGLAVAGYLGYRWWENRKASQGSGSPTGSFGTNLNSVAPELIAGSSGPDSGLDFQPQPQSVTVNYPSQITSSASGQPTPAGTTTQQTGPGVSNSQWQVGANPIITPSLSPSS